MIIAKSSFKEFSIIKLEKTENSLRRNVCACKTFKVQAICLTNSYMKC